VRELREETGLVAVESDMRLLVSLAINTADSGALMYVFEALSFRQSDFAGEWRCQWLSIDQLFGAVGDAHIRHWPTALGILLVAGTMKMPLPETLQILGSGTTEPQSGFPDGSQ
jgi:hypothetical protein